MLGSIVRNIVRSVGILYNNVKVIGKVGQIRDKLGKVITAPKKTGARTPMKRLECWFHISKWKASLRQLSLYFKNMHVVLQSEKLYMHSSFHNG